MGVELSHHLKFDSHRKIDDFGEVERLVAAFGDDVEVVGAQFVIKRDMTQQAVVFQVIREALPNVEMCPHPRGKTIIAVTRITVGFTHPIILACNPVEINACCKGFDSEPLAASDTPRDVVLLDRKGRMRPVGIGPGQKADQHVGLPAAFLPVVPSTTER